MRAGSPRSRDFFTNSFAGMTEAGARDFVTRSFAGMTNEGHQHSLFETAGIIADVRAGSPRSQEFARFARMTARTPAYPGFLHTLEGGNDGEGGNVSGILSHTPSRE